MQRLFLGLSLLLATPPTAAAREAAKAPPPVKLASVEVEAADPNLIGGEPADPKDWPASVYASMSGSRCSATVVGERVLLIASHCVRDGGAASFSVGANQYTSRCTHHPDYRRDSTADWALCLVDRVVTGTKFESVAVDASDYACRTGETWRLTGYGCTRAGGSGGNDGVYRIGTATVQSCPSRDQDTVTKGGAALCYGDSGGPAFKELEGGKRLVVGVNSRGDIRTTSYLSSTYAGKFGPWAKTWAQANGAKICGVHDDAGGCRDAGDPPPPPPPPRECDDELAAAVDQQGKAGAALAALRQCLTAPRH